MLDLIVIDITENEQTLLDGSLNKKEIKGHGQITIKNPSSKSRLWNLICDLKETVNTTINSREIDIGVLNPNREYNLNYVIENLKTPSLILTEKFDTNTDFADKTNNTFLLNEKNECKLVISINNPLEYPISNINISRDLLELFKDIEIKNPKIGIASIREENARKFLNWDVVTLEPKQETKLEITFNVTPSIHHVISLVSLKATYLASNHKLTLLNPEIRGLTDSISGIDRDETSQPGIWNCNVEFINESDFQVRLENVKITHKILSGEEMVVSKTPNYLLNPSQSWDYSFIVESKDIPELNSIVEFTPLYVVIKRVRGEIVKEPTFYPVLSAKINKKIQPKEVDAYTNTDMIIENIITNNGSSSIEKVKFDDTIPQDFLPPSIDQISIKLGEIDINFRAEFIESLQILPNNQNPDTYHKILITLCNLSVIFIPNADIKVIYPVTARDPRPAPEMQYKTPVSIEVNSPIEGKYSITSPDEAPEIIVKYVKRKLKTLKSIKPGLSEGEFFISIKVENKGDVDLENIIIKEKIPIHFELIQINVQHYDTNKVGDEYELVIKLSELKANESSVITYDCMGRGEYPRYEPEVIVQGRDVIEKPFKSFTAGSVPKS
ncbi:MAG: hypothetical protein ACFFKA_04420 [Candidatus Thorarchaeota archaeon]